MNFEDFGLSSTLLDALSAIGFKQATVVQQQAIPAIMQHRDVIACAQTGTGKTAAYLLPVIHHITQQPDAHIKCVIIAPTRELAVQIDQQIEGLAYFTGVSSKPVYGGNDASSFDREMQSLKEGADIIVATPGKFMTHLNLGYVKLDKVGFFILDEADRMLDMGFHDDIMRINSYMPKVRQTLMFSATMPEKIRALARKLLKEDASEIDIAISKPAENIIQVIFSVYENQKVPLIQYLLTARELKSVLVFCSRKSTVSQLASQLQKQSLNAEAVHSDIEQVEREKILRDFKNKKLPIIIATDVLSRGIDVTGIELVINYDVPGDVEDYVHRIGRTARAESKGAAFTFVNEDDQYKLHRIEQFLDKKLTRAKVPEELGETPEITKGKGRKNSRGHGGKKPARGRKR